MYKYGGVYLDMDSSILKPLRELINDDDNAIITTAEGNPHLYVQWAGHSHMPHVAFIFGPSSL